MKLRKYRAPRWASLEDDDLLDVRMCDLNLHIRGTILEERIARLYRELEERKIRLRPHSWIGEEWFAADGVPGIAVPFYLAHPRLMELERRQMLAVEGGPREECLRILRHEAGHALESAFRLNRRRDWRETFGRASKKYPSHYGVRPSSRDYVLHLGSWYAQSHPSEDFAETFAVWLNPRSNWRRRYAGWPALKKLEFVDRLMRELADTAPPVRSREKVDPLPHLRITLRDHYRRKQKAYAKSYPPVYDRALRRVFGEKPSAAHDEAATAFLRRHRRELIETVSKSLGVHPYVVDHLLEGMMLQTRRLGLRRRRSESRARLAARILLSVQTKRFLRADRHRMAL
jgi:hypothetical protein